MTAGDVVLEVDGMSSGYGPVTVLEDISIVVERGTIVTVLGQNGAGKSTLLSTIAGQLRANAGTVRLLGEDIVGVPPYDVVKRGISLVAEGRRIFRTQAVEDNLDLGMYALSLGRSERAARIAGAYDLFPVLRDKRRDPAGSLSGGQQQMLAVAQALVRRPTLLMLDEPSVGLSPLIVTELFGVFRALRDEGTTILLVEQVVDKAMSISDRTYVLRTGSIVASGSSDDLRKDDSLLRAYMG